MIAEPALDAPDEEWLVWADAMQQRGDPRGELLALGYRESYVKQHAKRLLGRELGRHVRKGTVVVTRWRRCYLDAVELRIDHVDDGPPLVVDLLRSPAAVHLRHVGIVGVPRESEVVDLSWTIEYLSRTDVRPPFPPTFESLALVDDRARSVDHLVSRNFDPAPNLVTFGPLVALWPAMEQLRELRIVVADPGQVQFAQMRLPNVRAFAFSSLCWTAGLGDMLADARWRELRSLELRLPDRYMMNNPDDEGSYRDIYSYERERDPITASAAQLMITRWREELAPIFDAIRKLPLERLALTSFGDVYGVLDALGAATLPASLVELDLSDSAFDDVGAARLAENAVMLQLKRLVLERVRLPSPKRLAGFGTKILHSCAPSAPTYRYIVGME